MASALDKHFAKMNAQRPKRSTTPGRRPRRSKSKKKVTNSAPDSTDSTKSIRTPLNIPEDKSAHFNYNHSEGEEEEDNASTDGTLSINSTNTANIRISRKARANFDKFSNGDGVKTKSIAKNFRLSRNHSRVLYHRSLSPSRKLLAAEIAVAAARRQMAGPYVPEPPPLELTPLILMRFTNKATPKLITLVEDRLRKSGLIIYDKVQDKDEPHYTYLYLSAAQEALETFAEQIRWMKRTNDTKVVEYFTVPNRRRFITKKKKRGNTQEDKEHNKNNLLGGDELFTSNEWCHLTFRLLDSVEVWLDNESNAELNLMLMLKDENFVPTAKRKDVSKRNGFVRKSSGSMPNRRTFRRKTSMDDLSLTGGSSRNLGAPASPTRGPGGGINRRANFHRQKSIMMQRVSQHGKRSSCLRHILEANEYVDVVTPLHWGPARKVIVQDTLVPSQLMPPVQEIRDYYGEDVAFYFAWMGSLSNWLVALGGMGVFTQGLQWIRHEELDQDEFTPMYGLFTFLWGVLFMRFWERHEHRLAYRWGTYSLSAYDKQKCLTTRPEFKGRLRVSPVTGDYETYYPGYKRRIQYTFSALVTTVMLGVAFWMMILSLNMQGFIHPERNPERWHPNNPHPFHYPSFAVLSERGYLFDTTHQWKSFLPSILHVAMIFTLNNLFRYIAEMLTKWENHETEATYRTSLIVKRFLFEAFDCYVALFYLAFYERDVDRLHMELVTVFNVDTFRRLAMECFIPLAVQKISKWLHPRSAHHFVSEADEELAKEEEEADMQSNEEENNGNTTPAAKPEKGRTSPNSAATATTAGTSASSEDEIVVKPLDPSKKQDSITKTKMPAPPKRGSITKTSMQPGKRLSASQARALEIQNAYKPPTMEELAEEADLDEYEAFDDYMEIVIQFGYVTLFASAYPLASLVALVANWVEVRSDCFKLAKVCRRPRSYRADGIGVWKTLLSCVVWMSALTNCLIVGFTSDQMAEIFPAFYTEDRHGDTNLVNDKGWIAVFVIFGLERFLIIVGLLIYAIVPGVPEDVQDEMERLHYVRALEHEEVLRQVMRKRANKKKN